jgi:hypothetical protein
MRIYSASDITRKKLLIILYDISLLQQNLKIPDLGFLTIYY